ncbi:MAG: DUF1318 domain-containing protein [Desulfobacteraceae bacterium]|nr:MAG: DUF1318 domain-containing protein [Desulfobacteraceae bacterium]
MQKNFKVLWLGAVLMSFIFACVTINIYFPVKEVESAAKDIVSDVTGKKPVKKPDEGLNFIKPMIEIFFVSDAWAQDAVTVSNPTIRALKETLTELYAQILPFFRKGLVKEGDDGYVALGETPGLGLKEKRDLKTLVDATNQNRATLYQEVAKALKIDPSQVGKVGETFAKEWKKALEEK